jgi:acetate CoA/acetoacetate CoA-transferase alpha subunit
MKNKVITPKEALNHIKSGDIVMVGGFLKCGTPQLVIQEILTSDIKDLTLIANDTCFMDSDRGLLVSHKKLKKVIASHIGTNPETGRQMNEGSLEVELVPQGTLAERIHAGGAGLGGVLTPTGIGTLVEIGKEKFTIDGKEYLLEKPLYADVALIYGSKVDPIGNISFHGTTRNFNTMMAMAAKTVIVEAEEYLSEPMNPDDVVISGIFVDHIIKKG